MMEHFDVYQLQQMRDRKEILDKLATKRERKVKPIVYISGPMTGKPNHNHEAFMEAEKFLRKIGFNVWNPAYNPREGYEWEDYMKVDLVGLLSCDLIFLLDGWEDSRGAKLEKYIADEMKIPELKASLIKLVQEVDFGENY